MFTLDKVTFKAPARYHSKVLKLQKWIKPHNPIFYIENLCRLKGLERIFIIHQPLQLAAEFKMPNKIFLDLRRPVRYIALCIAHEYAHLLLRKKGKLDYSVEQALAILLQLSYEDYAGIRRFKKVTAQDLMGLMKVRQRGKILLKQWPLYRKCFKKYHNILYWLKEIV